MHAPTLLLLLLTPSLSSLGLADDPQTNTPLEFSPDLKHPGYLGTVSYRPTAQEEPFFKKLPKDGDWTIQDKDMKFSLAGHDGEYVSWFGIVREIARDGAGRVTGLRIENKYATALSDAHLQTVSLNGAGDFRAELSSDAKDLLPLVLVRVYGRVAGAEQGMPVVKTEYLRLWHWFQFNFNDWGQDQSNPDWRRRIDLKGERVYSSRVSPEYYQQRLGPTPEQAEQIRAYHVQQQQRGETKPPKSGKSAKKKKP